MTLELSDNGLDALEQAAEALTMYAGMASPSYRKWQEWEELRNAAELMEISNSVSFWAQELARTARRIAAEERRNGKTSS